MAARHVCKSADMFLGSDEAAGSHHIVVALTDVHIDPSASEVLILSSIARYWLGCTGHGCTARADVYAPHSLGDVTCSACSVLRRLRLSLLSVGTAVR